MASDWIAISRCLLLEHDLFRPAFARRSIERADKELDRLRAGGKPVSTFRDHALKSDTLNERRVNSMALPKRDWLDMTWQDIAGAATARWIAVLPLAAVEQHGPHLPLGVDSFIADA
jgi:hypothetical protein